jgi:hypothetical protein
MLTMGYDGQGEKFIATTRLLIGKLKIVRRLTENEFSCHSFSCIPRIFH